MPPSSLLLITYKLMRHYQSSTDCFSCLSLSFHNFTLINLGCTSNYNFKNKTTCIFQDHFLCFFLRQPHLYVLLYTTTLVKKTKVQGLTLCGHGTVLGTSSAGLRGFILGPQKTQTHSSQINIAVLLLFQ